MKPYEDLILEGMAAGGDVVALASAPDVMMTVAAKPGSGAAGRVLVQWMDKRRHLRTAEISSASLLWFGPTAGGI